MTKDKLKAAEAEAKRFLVKASELRKVMCAGDDVLWSWSYPKQSGAVRRASMDLTRALADLRRPL